MSVLDIFNKGLEIAANVLQYQAGWDAAMEGKSPDKTRYDSEPSYKSGYDNGLFAREQRNIE
ncbi:hypothetical protein MEN41_12185 [Dolichospermum sp. ST_con]|jgi:hypothetical protein|nr:hypothetical protein [Dolichospermum sp. ST_con]MDD1421962.1 hypothetical protein [Dolichospermum sp. ST_sed1]MDD1426606.1 hypothetical protein [Dolichospermum sp. ST_sed9]MDD1434022.1 hypothetical protein [Dolichospermum sp. ST_sed6]MDD1437304.1 hypothetical protein [Dolichospermum sp. ST_sed10]MDD1442437.1 hypothetical protein [Dolichospermum sp. ST_sed3]MDD1448418.1 hypothetical protein [Dolichospermum sp. ST_sed8]MDD1457584.1 hypothetical protein [Dolichospermum sp. ST_sed7]MDD146221